MVAVGLGYTEANRWERCEMSGCDGFTVCVLNVYFKRHSFGVLGGLQVREMFSYHAHC